MDTNKLIQEKITELDNNFDKLILTNKLNINSIEDIAIKNIEDYKKIINNHIEDLIFKKIDEKELIIKKNENGKNQDMNQKIKENKNWKSFYLLEK